MTMKKLKIYYTSDVHGAFSPVDYATGSRIAAGLSNCIAGFKKDGDTLIIDGGDILQGSPFTYYLYSQTEHGGKTIASLMNIGGYDFVTLGNHDFNYGKTAIEEYLAALNAKCLCANVRGIRGVEGTAVITMQSGLRVGLAGVTTHYVSIFEKRENMRGITVTDAFTAAKEALSELKARHTDINICIYHGGYERDLASGALLSSTDENQGYRICAELDYDILLAGHQHMAAENKRVCGTFTCQPADKAKEYIERYFAAYPDVKKYLDGEVAFAHEHGYVKTIFGRRRPVPDINASNFMRRSFSERVAMNSPIQGSAADIMKKAMNEENRALRAGGYASRIVLQVHDELLIEAPAAEQEAVKALLVDKMQHAVDLAVELVADANVGENWDAAH